MVHGMRRIGRFMERVALDVARMLARKSALGHAMGNPSREDRKIASGRVAGVDDGRRNLADHHWCAVTLAPWFTRS